MPRSLPRACPLTFRGPVVAPSERSKIDRLPRHAPDRRDPRPLGVALSEGADWGSTSVAMIGAWSSPCVGARCSSSSRGRVKAPLVDLKLLRNSDPRRSHPRDPDRRGDDQRAHVPPQPLPPKSERLGMSALRDRLRDPAAAAAMILVTPLITPIAVKIGTRLAIVAGFGLSAIGFGVLAFVHASWAYAAFIVPLAVIAAGLGLSNGPPRRLDGRRPGGPGRPGLGHLEHGPLHRRLAVRRRHRHGLQLRDRGSPEERSVLRGRPRRSPLDGRVS